MTQLNQFMAVAVLSALNALGQDISGEWQGSLKAGPQELRVILQVTKSDNGGWTADLLSIDQSPDRGSGMAATSFSLDGRDIKFAIGQLRGAYDGKLSGDGSTITGIWTQARALPLDFRRATKETAWVHPSTHKVDFIPVEKNVSLEVLDWGGTGRPLVLLAGLGNTAHVFDAFALNLSPKFHVYGVTRRGFGASSAPSPSGDATYSADRLGDDVLAVLDALKLNRPILVGHSLAGEELSSVGSRHPERVAGLIYLEAAYSYAYYDRARGDLGIDLIELQRKLRQMEPGNSAVNRRQLIEDLLGTTLPAFERALKEAQKSAADGVAGPAAAEAVSPITLAARGATPFEPGVKAKTALRFKHVAGQKKSAGAGGDVGRDRI
ncbi:MAG: putative hydrolase or acyltransferase of alpha/beta superfamily, partial [Bryobacterales bacterium]|nr:putative hydrolase or acyltransferase of alpha/beta superfamily [Bryobacterales bacterium]